MNARLGANREATLKRFNERLGKPFLIELKQQPMREEWGSYPMLSLGNRITAAEAHAIEQSVRDKVEKYVISISVGSVNQATVFVGDDSFFRSARVYKVVRSDGNWRVESVKDLP